MAVPITLACWDHDRAMPVVDGTVPVPGFALEPHVLPTSQLFPIAVQEARFDVTELSMSSHLLQVSRGDAAYTAIPVFLSRAFRHNGFFRRAESGIATLADFRGRSIGVPEYQMTAALWMRGILADDFRAEDPTTFRFGNHLHVAVVGFHEDGFPVIVERIARDQIRRPGLIEFAFEPSDGRQLWIGENDIQEQRPINRFQCLDLRRMTGGKLAL